MLLIIHPPRHLHTTPHPLHLPCRHHFGLDPSNRAAMATGEPSSSTAPAQGIRRSFTIDESRHRPSPNRNPGPGVRRRSSNFSDYSFKTFQSSTDNLLLPKPSAAGHEESRHVSSHWDSAPLAFALLPAIGGMLFTNGSSVMTDIMLLGLAAIFLNWSVRLPWFVPRFHICEISSNSSQGLVSFCTSDSEAGGI